VPGRSSIALACLIFCHAATAQETPATALTVEQMFLEADVVGRIRIGDVRIGLDPENGMIYTDARGEFLELWKGNPPADFTLTRFGGKLGSQRASIPGGDFELESGEELVIFATPFRQNRYFILGLRQGLYRMRNGVAVREVTGRVESLGQLRSEIRPAEHTAPPEVIPASSAPNTPLAPLRKRIAPPSDLPGAPWGAAIAVLLVALALLLRNIREAR